MAHPAFFFQAQLQKSDPFKNRVNLFSAFKLELSAQLLHSAKKTLWFADQRNPCIEHNSALCICTWSTLCGRNQQQLVQLLVQLLLQLVVSGLFLQLPLVLLGQQELAGQQEDYGHHDHVLLVHPQLLVFQRLDFLLAVTLQKNKQMK